VQECSLTPMTSPRLTTTDEAMDSIEALLVCIFGRRIKSQKWRLSVNCQVHLIQLLIDFVIL